MASTPIGWTLEFDIKPGSADAFRKAANEAIAFTKAGPGTRHYEWFVTPDEKKCTVTEWFESQEGAVAHATGKAAEEVLPKLLAISTLSAFRLYGTPGPELTKALEPFPVTSRAAHIGGFTR